MYLVFLFSCQSNKSTVVNEIFFDPSEYVLIEILNDSEGVKSMELYRHKTDTNRHYTKTYWNNGNLQASLFYTNKHKMGRQEAMTQKGI